MPVSRAIAVAIHDVEPATYRRCALIRDWLGDLGIDRVTLLVIPAPDLHPFFERRPELAEWLHECRERGDAIAQHGFRHRPVRRPAGVRGLWPGEFPGLDEAETQRWVAAGRRTLLQAGLEPSGFVAPGYAYTPALHATLAERFDWWATLTGLWRGDGPHLRSPALGPAAVRIGARLPGRLLRLDLHPAYLEHPRHVRAVESVLRRAARRTAVTYDDLC
jgi:predicted deacetylase